MPRYPRISVRAVHREVTDCFRGLNRAIKTGRGEMHDMENLTSSYFPMLACRGKRGSVRTLESPGGLTAKEKLAYVEGGTLFYDGQRTALAGLTEGEKQLVSMGATICVFPDKKYYNTANPTDFGSMEASYRSTGAVSYTLCRVDGTEYESPTVSPTPPESPRAMQLWIDSSGERDALKQWSAESESWVETATVYTKLRFVSKGEVPGLFRKNDGVTITGAAVGEVNGEKIIQAIGGGGEVYDYIVIVGLLREAVSQTEGSVTIRREVPELDFVCECQNRLWGCRYGREGEKNLNEIYCCALGDFKNWRQYQGLSTDSWTASVGSDGPWTGAVNYLGSPMFFKENGIHTVTVSPYGAHRISETVCRGVQRGSAKSLAVVNETLYYKSGSDVCAYQGGFPVGVSEALGEEKYSNAAAGAIGDKYYIAMDNAKGERELFVYDIGKGLWMKEDGLNARAFARLGNELYCMTDRELLALRGSVGERERFVKWSAESGILYYEYPDKKYVSRFKLRMSMEEGAEMEIYIEYDSSGVWERMGRVKIDGTGTVTAPVCPRRCDHMRLRLEGKGEFRLFSIAKILEMGSDV